MLVSIKLMEDRQIERKGPQVWREYKRKVPSALMVIPPVLNETAGKWLYPDGSSKVPKGAVV